MTIRWWRFCGLALIVVTFGWLSLTSGAAEEEEDPVLAAVGGLSVGHMHTSQGLIGVTADAFAKDVYEAETVAELMGGLIGGIEANKKLLRKLQETELSDEDEQFIDGIIGVYNSLDAEAKSLIKFSTSKSQTDAKAFEKARKTAVARLQKLLGEDEDGDK